jgi:hypothetical protein
MILRREKKRVLGKTIEMATSKRVILFNKIIDHREVGKKTKDKAKGQSISVSV